MMRESYGYGSDDESAYGEEVHTGDQARLWERIAVVRRRWWLILLCGLAGYGIAHSRAGKQVDVYQATATVQRKQERTALQQAANAPVNLLSEIMILQSGAVMGDVADSLGLRVAVGGAGSGPPSRTIFPVARTSRDAVVAEYTVQSGNGEVLLRSASGDVVARADSSGWISARGLTLLVRPQELGVAPVALAVRPRPGAIAMLQRQVRLSQRPGTDLIDITATAGEPEYAAAVANGVVRAYQDFSSRTTQQTNARRREIIGTQLAIALDTLTAAQQRLADFQTQSGSIDPRGQGDAVEAQLVAARKEQSQLTYQISVLQNLLNALTSSGVSDEAIGNLMVQGRDLVPIIDDAYNRFQGYRTQRRTLTSGRNGLPATSPQVEQLDSAIAGTKREIRTGTAQSLAGLRAQLVTARDNVTRLATERSRYPEQASEFSRLEQRAAAAQSAYDALSTRYAEAQVAEQTESAKVDIIDSASVPASPIPYDSTRFQIVAAVLGLLAGVGLSFLLEYLDRKIHTAADVERASNLKILGAIPHLGGIRDDSSPLIMLNTDPDAGTEAFRMLRTTVQFARANNPKVIAVTSSSPSEGKSVIAANYAIAVAAQGNSVLLIDCDLRRPTVHRSFDLNQAPGLSDMLVGVSEFTPEAGKTNIPNLRIIPCGTPSPNPSELLGSKAFKALLARARETADTIILDTPPVLAVSDTTMLMSQVDGVLVVARSESTDRFALAHTVARLRQVHAPLMGAVLNGIRKRSARYGYGSEYGYYADAYTEYYKTPGLDAPRKRKASFMKRAMGRG